VTRRRGAAARKLPPPGITAREIAPTIGVSVATIDRHLPAPIHQSITAEGQTSE
jgi:hypothetical protein